MANIFVILLLLLSNQVQAKQYECSARCEARFENQGWLKSYEYNKVSNEETYDFSGICKQWCEEKSKEHDVWDFYSHCGVAETNCKILPPPPFVSNIDIPKTCCGTWWCNQTCPTYEPGCWPGGGSFTVEACATDTPDDAKALCLDHGPYVTYGNFSGDKNTQCK